MREGRGHTHLVPLFLPREAEAMFSISLPGLPPLPPMRGENKSWRAQCADCRYRGVVTFLPLRGCNLNVRDERIPL